MDRLPILTDHPVIFADFLLAVAHDLGVPEAHPDCVLALQFLRWHGVIAVYDGTDVQAIIQEVCSDQPAQPVEWLYEQ